LVLILRRRADKRHPAFQERESMTTYNCDIAFTAAVKAEQEKRGSRRRYEKLAQKRDWGNTVTDELRAFLAERDSFYVATVNGEGQPYIQHRGGPKGFVKVLDERTIAIADFAGNRQYITLGNLSENDRVALFFMDYPNRHRIKLWGRARFVEDDPALLESLAEKGYEGRPERALIVTIGAWDVNCSQHITPRLDGEAIGELSESLVRRIAELEAENAKLRAELAG